MTAAVDYTPVTFEERGLGFEVVRLGVVDVGYLAPRGAVVFWTVALPGLSARLRRSPNVVVARADTAACVRDWLEAAALCPASDRAPDGRAAPARRRA